MIADLNGNIYWLERPTGTAILVFDGNNAYWGDGSDERQINLNPPQSSDDLSGILGLTISGRMVKSVTLGPDPMIPISENGVISWVPANISGLPTVGFGVAAKVDAATDPEYLSAPNAIIVFNPDGEPTLLASVNNGDVLQIVGGQPIFAAPNSGSVASGISAVGLEGVVAQSIGVTQVNVKAPTFTVSDGATDLVIANLNETADITNPIGPNGLDVGGENPSTWYYVYAITDGVTPALLISANGTAPDLTNCPGYTHWGVISIFRNDAGGNIVEFVQKGREFSTVPIVWGNNVSSSTVLAPITSGIPLTTILPPMVKTCKGNIGGSTTASAVRSMVIAASASGIAKTFIGSRENSAIMENFRYDAGTFDDMPIVDPAAPVLYWRSNSNSANRRIEITGYKI